jgi:soluble P-type ATPase
MIIMDIPEFGRLELRHFVTDFSGTLSEDGRLLPGVKTRLNRLARKLEIHVLTSDTFGRAKQELDGVKCNLHILSGKGHSAQKEEYVLSLDADSVVALGNGNNDVRMLRAARLGVSVCLKEGSSTGAISASEVFVKSPTDAIDLLLFPKRLLATLRI